MLVRCLGPRGLLLALIVQAAGASNWATFSNSDCTTSIETYPGQNGYPDGVCTDIPDTVNSTYAGFMFTVLDTGCTPTIYQANTNEWTCSGATKLAEVGVCYNTSWQYYSLDQCTSPSSSSSAAVSTTTATTSTVHATAGASSSNSGAMTGGDTAGAIVGSVVGLGIVAAACAYFFWFRPKQQAVKQDRQRAIEQGGGGAWGPGGSTRPYNQQEAKYSPTSHSAAEMASPVAVAELANVSRYEAPAPTNSNGLGYRQEPNSVALELAG